MTLIKTYSFLKEISQNNNREWYDANKKKYQEAKKEFDFFVEKLIPALKAVDSKIDVSFAKECTFRIHRDVRFSKNKLPFKTNFGAYINRGGKKSNYAGFYVHIEPENSFVGGGLYMPQAQTLKIIRNEITYTAGELRKIIAKPEFKATFGSLQGEKLKTAPRGYPKDHKDIDLLRFKSFFVAHKLDDNQILDENLISKIEQVCKIMFPLNDYFNNALDDYEQEVEI